MGPTPKRPNVRRVSLEEVAQMDPNTSKEAEGSKGRKMQALTQLAYQVDGAVVAAVRRVQVH